jgi:thioredoxin-like negative regulator of GroEL
MDKKIIYLTLKGCHTCEQFKPTVDKVTKELNLPVEVYVLPDAPRDVKKMVYTYSIETFPTTLVVKGDQVAKLEGAKTESKLREFLTA